VLVNDLSDENRKGLCRVKALLENMREDLNESEKLYPDEPEVRVKKTVYMVLTKKLRD
jgi:hypothetical protein